MLNTQAITEIAQAIAGNTQSILNTNMVTTNTMLKVLVKSENLLTAVHAEQILNGAMSNEQARSCGGFMNAVLDGDYERALRLADKDNLNALHKIPD